MSRFDLTSVAQHQGLLFVEIERFCRDNMPHLPIPWEFEDLNRSELVHLTICLIADMFKLECLPLHKTASVRTIRLDEDAQDVIETNNKLLRNAELQYNYLLKQLNKLKKGRKSYHDVRDDISKLQNGFPDIRVLLEDIKDNLSSLHTSEKPLAKAKVAIVDRVKTISDYLGKSEQTLKSIIDKLVKSG
jgi:hypothetical protein